MQKAATWSDLHDAEWLAGYGFRVQACCFPTTRGITYLHVHGPHLDHWGKSWNGQHLRLKKFA